MGGVSAKRVPAVLLPGILIPALRYKVAAAIRHLWR